MKKISILLHEHMVRGGLGLLSPVTEVWRRMGFQIDVIEGISNPAPKTDLLIPSINLTVRPPEYREFISKFPNVLNRNVDDISKRKISSNLIIESDSYDGPVIVKTDKNYGGVNEARLLSSQSRMISRWLARSGYYLSNWRSSTSGPKFDRMCTLPSHEYPVFPSSNAVPPEVWSNENLIVEKFIPEREGKHYCIRVCLFLGSVALNRKIYSLAPIIKGSGIHTEPVDVPDELNQYRKSMGFDYGKIDYVVHNGKISVLDANNTPGGVADPAVNASIGEKLAHGIHDFVD